MRKNILMPLIILSLFVLFNSCSDEGGLNFDTGISNTDHSAQENFNYFVGINNQTRLVLEGVNGSIKISPTNEIAATIAGERKVQSDSDQDAENFMEYLKVIVEDRGDEVYVHTEQPDNSYGRILTVSYNIKIPAGWNTIISNINGGLQADSLNGSISASIVNGSIILNAIDASVNLDVVNGTIVSQIDVLNDGMCKMSLTNGTIALSIPQTANAKLNAKVVNGSVHVNNLTVQNITSSINSFNGTIGTGSAIIDLDTVNGEINVSGK